VILRQSPEETISDDQATRFDEFLLRKQEESEELQREGFANWWKESFI
jgi:hypothetical protein